MRGPGWAAVILLTVVISSAVSLVVQWAGDTGRLDMLWQGRQQEAVQPEPDTSVRPVPQLIGLPRKIAAELLKSRDLLLVVREEQHNPDIAAGSVLSQDPLPGSDLSSGGQVSVVLSKGPGANYEVPALEGTTLEAATRALQEAELSVGSVQGPDGGAGRLVVSTDPPAGQGLMRGSEVNLVVELAPVEVPEVVGLNMRKAKKALEAAGLKLGKVRRRFDDLRPEWAVLSQEPEAGEKVPVGTEVNLIRNN